MKEGRCKATWKTEFKVPWREAGPLDHHDDKVDSDQQGVNKELSRCQLRHQLQFCYNLVVMKVTISVAAVRSLPPPPSPNTAPDMP
jgi:hypothetical protein